MKIFSNLPPLRLLYFRRKQPLRRKHEKSKAVFRDIARARALGNHHGFRSSLSQGGVKIVNNTPRFVATAKNIGAVDPSTVIEVSVWLNPHNKSEMDVLAKDLYDPSSSTYRHWLTPGEFAARFAPTAAESAIVKAFFTSNGMSIVTVGPNNFYVRARGTVAAVNKAFHVTLNNYQFNGKTVRANASDPSIAGEAGSLVASIAGLDSMTYTHPLLKQSSFLPARRGGNTATATGAANGANAALPFDPVCFAGTETETLVSTFGDLPIATYTGNSYTNNTAGCGYTPENIYSAYNLKALYAEGYDGAGQSIAIIDWCGSPTITQDANLFSAQFGLPPLTTKNFQQIYTAKSYCISPDPEINIDVEWAHAIAPGANIALVIPPTASFQDVDEAFFHAVNFEDGNVISGSYGSEEYGTPVAVLEVESLIAETAAVLGISANFSSGDYGDFTYDLNVPELPPSVSAPADVPYATAVGGITLALNAKQNIAWQAGWGNNLTDLSFEGTVYDPPFTGFYAGSGGGPSGYFAKPYYQYKLPGNARELPDISWIADPFTGVYIAISEPGQIPETVYTVYGGTSVACPMFSALWAIAGQEAGMSLGQAAPYLYFMPGTAILDVVPQSSKTNVTGKIINSDGKTTYYSAAALAAPLEKTTTFISDIWNYPLDDDTAYVVTFGTDSGLTVTKGWDDVTGVGVPNGKAFADYFGPR